jgi:diguanylate cyclase (GGDEF)-like protein
MRRLSFRQKVVLLAVMLVVGIQLATLFPVLNLLERDSGQRADRALVLAGAVLSEFMDSRGEQFETTSAVTVADYAFREAMATDDPATIRSVLANHAARLDADFGVFVELDGRVIASVAGSGAGEDETAQLSSALSDAEPNAHSVVYVGERAFQTVSVAVRSPLPIGTVVFGFEVGSELAFYLNKLTGLQVTFLRFHDREPIAVATTMSPDDLEVSLAEIQKYGGSDPEAGGRLPIDLEFLTLLRPFLLGTEELFVALQMPVEEARASYIDIRSILMVIGALSLIAALGGSFWIAAMVAQPVQRLAAAVRRMREGVYDEIVESDSPDEFGELAVGFNEMQEAIADREEKISYTARHDELTGLPNRQHVVAAVTELIAGGQRFDVASLSITRINRLVVSLGQHASDQLIQRVAEVLRENIGVRHVLGYVQGHEFLLVFVRDESGDVGQLIDELSRLLRRGVRVGAATFLLQLRAGVASHPEHSDDAAALLYRAGIARVEAEAAHDLLADYALGQEERAVRQTRLIGEFPKAVESGELRLHVQPKVDCRTRRVSGVEALVRWEHPELGLLSPYEFVNAIEQAGSISTLTRWVLRSAIAECRRWRDGGVEIGVAVNISADDLLDEYLPYYLLELTNEYGIRPAQITLEITESAIMHNLAKSLSVVACIHEIGFRLSIDDFGTGHSSLAQLRRLPVNELKIDRSFVRDVEDHKDEAIVAAMIDMAYSLGLEVCVEGVEDEALLDRLEKMGARYGQGYAISRPMPSEDFLEWYESWSAKSGRSTVTSAGAGTPRAVV